MSETFITYGKMRSSFNTHLYITYHDAERRVMDVLLLWEHFIFSDVLEDGFRLPIYANSANITHDINMLHAMNRHAAPVQPLHGEVNAKARMHGTE